MPERKRLHHSPVPNMTDAEREAAVNGACGDIVELFQTPDELPKALAPMFLNVGSWMSKWSIRNQIIAYSHGAGDAMTIWNWNRYAGRVPLETFTAQHEELGYIPGGFIILKPYKVPIWITIVDEETGEKKRVKRSKIVGFLPHYVYPEHNTEIVDEEKNRIWNARNEKAQRVLEDMPFIEMLQAKDLKIRVENTGSYGILGYYQPGTKVIALGVENMSTAMHEVGHYYDDVCGNLTKGEGQNAGNEIVAEMFGATILTMIGQEHEADLGGAWEYIRRYAKAKAGDTSTVAILGAVSDLMWRVKASMSVFFQDVEEFEEAA